MPLFRRDPYWPARVVARPLPPSRRAGVLTFTDFVTNAGAAQASTSSNYAHVFDSTGVTLIVSKSFSTDSGADATVTDALIVPGTSYRIAFLMADGKNGAATLTAT